jgi:hypothetical protein
LSKVTALTFDADAQTDSDSEVGSEDGHVLITLAEAHTYTPKKIKKY